LLIAVSIECPNHSLTTVQKIKVIKPLTVTSADRIIIKDIILLTIDRLRSAQRIYEFPCKIWPTEQNTNEHKDWP
jgi:hypothetical protein